MITNIKSKYNQKNRRFILFLIIFEILFFFQIFVGCQNETNIINNEGETLKAQCKGNTLKYYFFANLSLYLEIVSKNYSSYENRPIYTSVNDIKTIGVIEGTVYENISQKFNLSDIKTYNSYDEIIFALRRHIIDGFITCKEFGDIIKMNNEDLTYLENNNSEDIIHYNFLIQNFKNKTLYKFEEYISNNINELKEIWFGCDNSTKKINQILTGDKGSIIVALNYYEPPYSYLDENGNVTGLILDLLYGFANSSNYTLEILEIDSYYDLKELMDNNTADIYGFMSHEKVDDRIILSKNIFGNETKSVIVIRDENSDTEKTWDINSIESFENEKIGALNDTLDLTKNIFQESEVIIKESVIDLFNSLLLNEISGFIIDELTADYYKQMANSRIFYYPEGVGTKYLGFFFTNEEVRNQFNEFIPEIKAENITVDEILNESEAIEELINDLEGLEILNVIIKKNIRPFAYIENGIYKGFEINILYNFSNKYNYSLSFNRENETNNVYIGCLNISNNQELGFPSDVLYESNIVLLTRKDKIKNEIDIKILDSKYREKKSNDILVPLTYSNISKSSFCLFPTKYRDNIILNCSIFGLHTENKFKGDYELGKTNNKIKIKNLLIEAQNFLNANDIFPGYDIINHTNMSDIICPNYYDMVDLKKIKSNGFKITTASIIGIVVVGILFAAAILIVIIMYTTEIKNQKKKKNYKLANSELKLN